MNQIVLVVLLGFGLLLIQFQVIYTNESLSSTLSTPVMSIWTMFAIVCCCAEVC